MGRRNDKKGKRNETTARIHGTLATHATRRNDPRQVPPSRTEETADATPPPKPSIRCAPC
eukprot:1252556-Pleurochrysis_carterae.AAC.1